MAFKPIKIWAGRNSVPMREDLEASNSDAVEAIRSDIKQKYGETSLNWGLKIPEADAEFRARYNELPSTYDAANFKLFHNSEHKFEPGDIVKPTMSIYHAAGEQGMDDEERKGMSKKYHAWAAATPDYQKTRGRYTYEVEPITKHSWVQEDPVGFENGEFAAPEGYRVKQVVWDKEKDSCPTCEGNGVHLRVYQNAYPYHPECTDCFGTGLSTSKIVGLQKAGHKLDEIKAFKAPIDY
jgi:hypothetical protein